MAGKRGRTPGFKMPDEHRHKIKVSNLLNLLQRNAEGTVELDSVRQRSIEILLRKAMPDLSAVEQTGQTQSFVALLPEVCATADEWMAKAQKPVEAPRTAEAPEATEIPVKH